ncbi:MAG: LysM peptidoglycan-binding domain-containing protein [Deltaproteobacteria bacterium]|nr:LysM peptidoglycan-binding domain-containing protein [Deltaproteobacteria bacterium]
MVNLRGSFISICLGSLLFISCAYPVQIDTQQVFPPAPVKPKESTVLEQDKQRSDDVTEKDKKESVTLIDKNQGAPLVSISKEEDILFHSALKGDSIAEGKKEMEKPYAEALSSAERVESDAAVKEISIGEGSNGEGKNQDQEKTDAALELLSQSQNLWEKGDLDASLALLDDAYYLIIELDGDPNISWQKDDLRFLIAKRILEIYTARSNVATGHQSEVPLVMNNDVQKEIKLFQTSEKNFFIRSYKRSGLYRPMILEKLKEAGLPEELSWLPLVESGFKIIALSRARALGLWQFIPSTGYKFGLKRDDWIDERMDAEKSTDAAIAYLKELHEIFGDWYTVLASYNCGEGRVLRVISRQHMNYLDNFWDLYRQLPSETARYVPRFIATLHIIKDPEKYGIDLGDSLDEPIPYETVTVKKSMQLKDIAQNLGVPENTINAINSELRHKITPDGEYVLKIPLGMAEKFALVADKIPRARKPGPTYVRHKVRSGESLSVIANRYKTSINAIVAANNLRSQHSIRIGTWLKIPSRGYVASGSTDTSGKPSTDQKEAAKGEIIKYRVKRGDSLWLLAKRYDTTVSEIKRLSGLSRSSLYVGQIITIRNGSDATATTSTKTYTVKKGDSLSVIAERHRISLAELLRLNNFNIKTILYPGQTISVRNGSDATATTSTNTYTVKRGDSLSVIAERHRISLAELLRLNNFNTKTTLYPGQTIVVTE